MRLVLPLACLLLVGCAGPHSTGALWAQQNLAQELIAGRQTDSERAAREHTYELTLADESLAAERARIDSGLHDCPGGALRQLELSSGDRVRDAIRLRVGDDAQRQAAVAQVALADWRLRRAMATGEAHFCAEARQALTGPSSAEATTGDPLGELGSATVTREPRYTVAVADLDQLATTLILSNYALGYVDTVRARAPLPHYLAAVYGGVVTDVDRAGRVNIWVAEPTDRAGTLEDVVDRLAPVYPQWEPDAIYAALRPA